MKTLKEAYKNYFKVGAAVNAGNYLACKDIITANFDTITCENEMKYLGVCDENEHYDFTDADKLYHFARENGLEVRGHNFVWHEHTPQEHLATFSEEALWQRLREHISMVSERYSEVFCWDVINEAIDDKHGDFLRETVWRNKFGDKYYLKVYRLARELVPNVPLVYNDYNEFFPEKRAKIIRLLNELKSEGLVDIAGLQGHITVPEIYSLDELKRTLEDFTAIGLPIHITEMDISFPSINISKNYDEMTAEEAEAHAKMYGDIFAVFREYSEVIESVTLWGVTDEQSWLNYRFGSFKRSPLLFGRDHKPNEAFLRVTEF